MNDKLWLWEGRRPREQHEPLLRRGPLLRSASETEPAMREKNCGIVKAVHCKVAGLFRVVVSV